MDDNGLSTSADPGHPTGVGALRKLQPMTASAFLDWDNDDRSGRRWQLRDGQPEAMAPASRTHGAIQAELARLIGNHLLAAGRPCQVVIKPGIVPRVRRAENIRIPDLTATRASPDSKRPLADPVLVVEILSRSTADRTWANIWAYASIPSVAEILVVSATERRVELLRRGTDGNWPGEPAMIGPGETLDLASIGMTVMLDGLYRTTALA